MFQQDLDKIEVIKKHIKAYPDFPKKGILFRDIFSCLIEPTVFSLLREVILNYAKNIKPPVECIAALEARGFLFGPTLALDLQVPFIPIRKKGKLPGNTKSVKYSLEYGEDELQIQVDSIKSKMRVLLVDDLLATGGSLAAACKLLQECGADIASCLVVIELEDLKGKSLVPVSVHSIVQY